MKKNLFSLLMILMAALLLGGCSTETDAEYQDLKAENEDLANKVYLQEAANQFLVDQNADLTSELDELQNKLDNVPIDIDNIDFTTIIGDNQNIAGSYWDDDQNLYILYASGLLIYGDSGIYSNGELYFSQGRYTYDRDNAELLITLDDTTTIFSVDIGNNVGKGTSTLLHVLMKNRDNLVSEDGTIDEYIYPDVYENPEYSHNHEYSIWTEIGD